MQIYKAERPEWPVRVYNLLYEDSQEADKFAAAVAREVKPSLQLRLFVLQIVPPTTRNACRMLSCASLQLGCCSAG